MQNFKADFDLMLQKGTEAIKQMHHAICNVILTYRAFKSNSKI